jgi:hypothetical protein
MRYLVANRVYTTFRGSTSNRSIALKPKKLKLLISYPYSKELVYS